MLTFEELKQILNENSIVGLYDANHNILGFYDGFNDIDEEFDDCYVEDIFSDMWGKVPAIGVEISYLPFD